MAEMDVVEQHIAQRGIVSIHALAYKLGIKYSENHVEGDVRAEIDSSGRPSVVVNSELPEPDRRRAAAQGVAHLLLHKDEVAKSGGSVSVYVTGEEQSKSAGEISPSQMKEAHDFADNLVMPESRIKEAALDNRNHDVSLAREMGVSVESMQHRMHTLGVENQPPEKVQSRGPKMSKLSELWENFANMDLNSGRAGR